MLTLYSPRLLKRTLLTGGTNGSFTSLLTAFNNVLLSVFNQGRDVVDVQFEFLDGTFSLVAAAYEPFEQAIPATKTPLLRKKCFVQGFSDVALETALSNTFDFLYNTLPFENKDFMKFMYVFDGSAYYVVVVYFETWYDDFLEATET